MIRHPPMINFTGTFAGSAPMREGESQEEARTRVQATFQRGVDRFARRLHLKVTTAPETSVTKRRRS